MIAMVIVDRYAPRLFVDMDRGDVDMRTAGIYEWRRAHRLALPIMMGLVVDYEAWE